MSGNPDPPASAASVPPATDPPATVRPAECRDTLERLIARSLGARTPDGHWTGELSSSALATATAAIALALVGRDRPRRALEELVRNGLAWLVATQGADGGWGDTTDSPSNVSTTALVWAALTIAGNGDAAHRAALERVRNRMLRDAGSLEPQPLARTISRRYGKDRTFSVPILTVLALAGLLRGYAGGGGVRRGTRAAGSAADGDMCRSSRTSWPRCRRPSTAGCGFRSSATPSRP